MSAKSMVGRSAVAISLVFNTSLASRGDEMTILLIWPSLMCMMGPYFLARSRKTRCGSFPATWCRLPISGNFGGPGGRFRDLVFLFSRK